ncbi:MAG: sensor histidine kinase [Panacagrimonas sp.]
MARVEPVAPEPEKLIPDFCSGPALFTMAVVMELVAVCFALAQPNSPNMLRNFALLSLYMQWIGLCASAALCLTRRLFRLARPGVVFLFCWGVLILIVMGLSNLAWILGTHPRFGMLAPGEPRVWFVLRHTGIAALVALMLLRYYWTRHQWLERVRTESEFRYQALNARIRPHFFFNALNSLAALITIRPADAELMVEDLADVFRASLDQRGRMVPFVDEIGVCNAYLRIEKARLAEKLNVQWDVPEPLLNWRVPMLLLQPLVENAVYHGISKMREGGTLRVHAYLAQETMIVEVENPMPASTTPKSSGNQIALGNIASRLKLIYGEGGRLELGPAEGIFRARLFIPKNVLSEAGEML